MFRTGEIGSPPPGTRAGTYLHLSPFRVLCLAALLLLPWVIVFSQTRAREHSAGLATAPTHPANGATRPTTAQALPEGPWGELEYTPIIIEPPADSVARFAATDTSTWYFRNCTPSQLESLLKAAGLSDDLRQAILRTIAPDPQANGLTARPDPNTLAALPHVARAAIYQTLAHDPRNPQAEPFRHRAAGPDWFAGADLPADLVSTARRFVYRRGDMEAFVDVSAVFPAIPNDETRARFFRTLASESALVLRLRVRPDSDLKQLVAYWGRGGVGRDVAPLLESLSKVPGGDTVDVAQLLPAFPRTRLNTYPPPVNLDGSDRGLFDCHWTSLNFWNTMPDNRFTDTREAARQFDTAYRVVDAPTQLGDIVVLTGPQGQGIHSATFIAADVVFTKNGTSITAPWILMRLPDVIAYYETQGPVKTITYRRKDL
jgi:hypothetical protein